MAKKFLDYDGLEEVVSQVKSLLLDKQDVITLTGSKAVQTNSSGKLEASAVTNTELGYLSGVTSAIQTQLNGKQATLTAGDNITISTINNLLTISAMPGIAEITQATNIEDMAVGVYKGQSNYFIYNKTNQTAISNITPTYTTQCILIVSGDSWNSNTKDYVAIIGFQDNPRFYYGWSSEGQGQVREINMFNILQTTDVKNNLTSTLTTAPLSAAQGKALNDNKQATYTADSTAWDTTPTTNSTKPVTSGGIYTALDDKVNKTTTASQIYATDNNSTVGQTTLTYDTAATAGYIVQRATGGQITVPATPSADTDAASKGFVNSSIGTNTANFIGTFEDIPSLNDYSGTVTNNDYAFVVNSVITDDGGDWANTTDLNAYDKTLLTNFDYAWVVNGSNFDLYRFDIIEQTWGLRVQNTAKADVTLNTAYNRYKASVSGSTVTWAFEYTLNNSSFTASQWAAINSGITSALVTDIGNKVPKSSSASQVYITDGSSNTTTAAQGTAFNKSFETSTTNIKMNGSVSVGSSNNVARADHIHPTDTTRLATYASSSSAWDTTPTANSTNPVTSGGIKTALDGKEDTMTAITITEIDNLFNS